MRVIFLEDVPNVANAGDLKTVSDGFARNYLIPKKLAAIATPDELKRVERIKKVAQDRRVREREQWTEVVKVLEGTSVTVKGKVSPAGQFYGSITAPQVAEELAKVTGREVDRRWIELGEPIKVPGSYSALVKLQPGIEAKISVVAESEE